MTWYQDGLSLRRLSDDFLVRAFASQEDLDTYHDNLLDNFYGPELAVQTFPASDWHSAKSGQKCSRWGCDKDAVASRSTGQGEMGACGTHKTEMTQKSAEVETEQAAHDLVFFEKRSTPLVVSKGAAPSTNSNYTEKYGKQTSRRAATADEEAKIKKGQWVQVDSSGKKSGEDGYKKTKYRPALVKQKSEAEEAAETPAGANAPYKIQKRDGKFVVVNNAGLVKATFTDRDKALAYQRALYVNVPGAAKRADKTKFSGKARNRVPDAK